ncbi:hypothetical protein [Mycobacterium sp. ZZG]
MSAPPLNRYNADQAVQSQPVLWWVLINQAEWITAQTGWGLANTWYWIHKGDYLRARENLNNTRAMLIESGVLKSDTPWTQ